MHRDAEVVLVSVGVRTETALAVAGGAALGARGAIAVDWGMRTDLPDVFAEDWAVTRHRLLGDTHLPLGTTAHKQGRVAGENAVGGDRLHAGSLGTQVVKIFDHVAGRTGLRDHEGAAAGYRGHSPSPPRPTTTRPTTPTATQSPMRYTADRDSGALLGLQLFGHRHAEIAKRVDIAAVAIHNAMTIDALSDLDLSYTPLGRPWDAIQTGAQAWVHIAATDATP